MRQLLDVFERHGGPVLAVMRMPRDEIGRYGVMVPRDLGGNVYEVQDLVEKPNPRDAPSDLAIIGRYVLTPDIFAILEDTAPDSRGEIQLTNGLRALRGRRLIYAVEFEGKRHDTGEKLGFLKASPSRARTWRITSGLTSRASTFSRVLGASPPPRPPLPHLKGHCAA